MKSKSDEGISLIYLCYEDGIPEELINDNYKDESMPLTMMQRIMSNFYIMGSSSETYTQQQNNYEGQIRDLQYQ